MKVLNIGSAPINQRCWKMDISLIYGNTLCLSKQNQQWTLVNPVPRVHIVVLVLRRHLMDKQNHYITVSLGDATLKNEVERRN